MEVVVDVLEVLDNAHLISVPCEQADDLPVIHAPKNSALTDLEAIHMQDWKHRS